MAKSQWVAISKSLMKILGSLGLRLACQVEQVDKIKTPTQIQYAFMTWMKPRLENPELGEILS
jgi:hypothetical protein